MRVFFILLMASFVLNAAPGRFTGQWVAKLKGSVICTLEIEEPGGKIAGVSKSCHISVDQNGELLEAGVIEKDQDPLPFFNPKADGSTLTYELLEDDGERMKFEFKLTAEGKADLRFLSAPIAIKPIHFERQ